MNTLDSLHVKYLAQRLSALEEIVEGLGVAVLAQLPAIAPALNDLAEDWKAVAKSIDTEYQTAVDAVETEANAPVTNTAPKAEDSGG